MPWLSGRSPAADFTGFILAIVLQLFQAEHCMNPTTELRKEGLSLKQLRELCESIGPCITILSDAYKAAATGPSGAARLKSAIPVAEPAVLPY